LSPAQAKHWGERYQPSENKHLYEPDGNFADDNV
jgi:hypothetical protein